MLRSLASPRALLALLFAMAPTACQQEETVRPLLRSEIASVTLDCQVHEESDGVRIAYTVRNDSNQDIAVFNRISNFEGDGAAWYSPDRVYVDLDGREIHIGLIDPPLFQSREDINICETIGTDVSVLAAGAVLKEDVFLAEPIKVWNPTRRTVLNARRRKWGPLRGKGIQAINPESADRLTFSVGFVAIPQGETLQPASRRFPGVFLPPHVFPSEVLTKAFDLRRPIRVLDYAVSY